MNNLGKYSVGIIIGIAALVVYIFAYHKPELKKEYKRGYDAAIASIVVSPPDTVIRIDTVKPPAVVIKPKPSNNHSPIQPITHSIDTLIRYPEADIYVYSDDVLDRLFIEPIFHITTITITDTLIKTLTYEVDKPEPWYNTFEAGAVVGGSVVAVLAYIFTRN